ncbi:MAG: class I SAM-dependent methyltransferase, partial [Nevskia sp.]|nr:class I SAM-dependent methyltransferase [Nevskia sp.]
GPDAAASIQAASERFTQGIARYLRAFLVARSRYAEDELRKAVDSGASQYVVLGAGLDTSTYRNRLPRLRMFRFPVA